VNEKVLQDLRGDDVFRACTPGKGQPPAVCAADPHGTAPPDIPQQKPTGEAISVRQLQHKIPREAAREFERALKFSRAGEHEKAAAELEAALRRDPELVSAENQLGVEYSYLGRWDEAEMAFRRAVDIEPAWWMGHYNLALILYSRGDRSGAEQSARHALALSNDNPRIHLLLGEMLVVRAETRAEGLTELRFAARTLSDARWVLRVLGTQ
jgi:Tfp pilus assembly protein PilF